MRNFFILLIACLFSATIWANGLHDVSSPVVGVSFDAFTRFQKVFKANKVLQKFSNALYYHCPYLPEDKRCESINPDNRVTYKIIPMESKNISNFLADQMLETYLGEFRLEKNEAINFDSYFPGLVRINDQNNWYVELFVNKDGFTHEDYYTPSSIIALHEFLHIERMTAGQKRLSQLTRAISAENELVPSLDSTIKLVQIMEAMGKINSLEKHFIPSEKGSLQLVPMIRFYQGLMDKYQSYEDALASKESIAFLLKYFEK